MDCSMPGLPVYHQLLELTQTHVCRVSDTIQPSHPLSSPSPPALNLSQHQGLFKWVSFASGGQSIAVSASTSVLPMNIQDWFPLGWTWLRTHLHLLPQEIWNKMLCVRKALTSLESILKSRDITLPTKVHIVKSMVFPVVTNGCELDCKQGWALKNWWFQTVVLKKTLESPLDSKEIKPVNPKGNQSWVFIGRTDAEAETPILWPPDAKLTHWKRPWC